MNRKLFFDTEFVVRGTALYPISIGVVDLDGREFYAEVESPWQDHASSWVVRNVVPHLDGREWPVERVRKALCEFVGTAPVEFWAYMASYDWVVLCQLMGGLVEFPPNWPWFVRDLAWLDPTLTRIRSLNTHNPKRHHALHDARELRECYLALTSEGEGEASQMKWGDLTYEQRRALAADGPRCSLTGNPCLTDTWQLSNPPNCNCGKLVRGNLRLQQELKDAKAAAERAG